MLSNEEFEKLKSMPFEELTSQQKMLVNLRHMASMSDEQVSAIFTAKLNEAGLREEENKEEKRKTKK